jgi:lipocalin
MKIVVALVLALMLTHQASTITWVPPALGDIEPFCRDPYKRPVTLQPIRTPIKTIYLKGNWYEIARTPTEVGGNFTCGQMIIDQQRDDFVSPSKMLYLESGRSVAIDFNLSPMNVDQTKLVSNLFKKTIHMWILELDPSYSWVVFGEPCKKTAWIYSITASVSDDWLADRVRYLEALGFKLHNLLKRKDQNCPDILPQTSFIPGNPISSRGIEASKLRLFKLDERKRDDNLLRERDERRAKKKAEMKERRAKKQKEALEKGLPFFDSSFGAEETSNSRIEDVKDLADVVEEAKTNDEIVAEQEKLEKKRQWLMKKLLQIELYNVKLGNLYTRRNKQVVKKLMQDEGFLENLGRSKAEYEEEIAAIKKEIEEVDKQIDSFDITSSLEAQSTLSVETEVAERNYFIADKIRDDRLKESVFREVMLNFSRKEINPSIVEGVNSALEAKANAEAVLKTAKEQAEAAVKKADELSKLLQDKGRERAIIFKRLQEENLKPEPRTKEETEALLSYRQKLQKAVEEESEANKNFYDFSQELNTKETELAKATQSYETSLKTIQKALIYENSEKLTIKNEQTQISNLHLEAKAAYEEAEANVLRSQMILEEKSDKLKLARIKVAEEKKNLSNLLIKKRFLVRKQFKTYVSLNAVKIRYDIAFSNNEDSSFLKKYYDIAEEISRLSSDREVVITDLSLTNDNIQKSAINLKQSQLDNEPAEVIARKEKQHQVNLDEIAPLEDRLHVMDEKIKKLQDELETMNGRYKQIILKRQIGLADSDKAEMKALEDAKIRYEELKAQVVPFENSAKLLQAEYNDLVSKLLQSREKLSSVTSDMAEADEKLTYYEYILDEYKNRRSIILNDLLDAETSINKAEDLKQLPEPKFMANIIEPLNLAPIDKEIQDQQNQVDIAQKAVSTLRKSVFIAEARIIEQRAVLADLLGKSSPWAIISAQLDKLKASLLKYDEVLVPLGQAKQIHLDLEKNLRIWQTKKRVFIAGLKIANAYKAAFQAAWKEKTTNEADKMIEAAKAAKAANEQKLKQIEEKLTEVRKQIDAYRTKSVDIVRDFQTTYNTKEALNKAATESFNQLQKTKIQIGVLKNSLLQAEITYQLKQEMIKVPQLELQILDNEDEMLHHLRDGQEFADEEDGDQPNEKVKQALNLAQAAEAKMNSTNKTLVDTQSKILELEKRFDQVVSSSETTDILQSVQRMTWHKNAMIALNKILFKEVNYQQLIEKFTNEKNESYKNLVQARNELKVLSENSAKSLEQLTEAIEHDKPVETVTQLKDANIRDGLLVMSKKSDIEKLEEKLFNKKKLLKAFLKKKEAIKNEKVITQAKIDYYEKWYNISDMQEKLYAAEQSRDVAQDQYFNALTDDAKNTTLKEYITQQKQVEELESQIEALKAEAKVLYQPIKAYKDAKTTLSYNRLELNFIRHLQAISDSANVDNYIKFYSDYADEFKSRIQEKEKEVEEAKAALAPALQNSAQESKDLHRINELTKYTVDINQEEYETALKQSVLAKAKSRQAKKLFIERKRDLIVLRNKLKEVIQTVSSWQDKKASAQSKIEMLKLTFNFQDIRMRLIRQKLVLTALNKVVGYSEFSPEYPELLNAAQKQKELVTNTALEKEKARDEKEHATQKFINTARAESTVSLTKQKFEAEVELAELTKTRTLNKESIALANREVTIKKNLVAEKGLRLVQPYREYIGSQMSFEKAENPQQRQIILNVYTAKKRDVINAKREIIDGLLNVEKAVYDWQEEQEAGRILDNKIMAVKAKIELLSSKVPLSSARKQAKQAEDKAEAKMWQILAQSSIIVGDQAAVQKTAESIVSAAEMLVLSQKSLQEAKDAVDAARLASPINQTLVQIKEKEYLEADEFMRGANSTLASMEAKLAGLKKNLETSTSTFEVMKKETEEANALRDKAQDYLIKVKDEFEQKAAELRRVDLVVLADNDYTIARGVAEQARLIYRSIKVSSAVPFAEDLINFSKNEAQKAVEDRTKILAEYKVKVANLATAMKAFKKGVKTQTVEAIKQGKKAETNFMDYIPPVIAAVEERFASKAVLFHAYVKEYMTQMGLSRAYKRLGVAKVNQPKAAILTEYIKAKDTEEALHSSLVLAQDEKAGMLLDYSMIVETLRNTTIDIAINENQKRMAREDIETVKAISNKANDDLRIIEERVKESKGIVDQAIAEREALIKQFDRVDPNEYFKRMKNYRQKEAQFLSVTGEYENQRSYVEYLTQFINLKQKNIEMYDDDTKKIKELQATVIPKEAEKAQQAKNLVENKFEGTVRRDLLKNKFDLLTIANKIQDQIIRANVNFVDVKVQAYFNRIYADIEGTFAKIIEEQTPEADLTTAAQQFYKLRRELQGQRISINIAKKVKSLNLSVAEIDATGLLNDGADKELTEKRDKALAQWTAEKYKAYRHEVAEIKRTIYTLKNSAYAQIVAVQASRKENSEKNRDIYTAYGKYSYFVAEGLKNTLDKPVLENQNVRNRYKVDLTKKLIENLKSRMEEEKKAMTAASEDLSKKQQELTLALSEEKPSDQLTKLTIDLREAGIKSHEANYGFSDAEEMIDEWGLYLQDLENEVEMVDENLKKIAESEDKVKKNIEESKRDYSNLLPVVEKAKQNYYFNCLQYISKMYNFLTLRREAAYYRILAGRSRASTHLALINK